MDILIIMCLGMIVGKLLIPAMFKKHLETLQMVITITLIFTLGVGLGQRDNFLHELITLGLDSFLFFLIPTVFSVVATFLVTCKLFGKKGK